MIDYLVAQSIAHDCNQTNVIENSFLTNLRQSPGIG